MSPRRLPPWDASGLVEKAWKRLEPPTREQLAELLGLKAATNLSKLNTGSLPMTLGYAERIVAVVPGLTVADLGAPSAPVAEADPTVLDRLEAAEAGLRLLRGIVLEGFDLLDLEVDERASDPRSPRVRRAPRRQKAAGGQ